jgi:predicted Zn finger-like uncharacterized protein
MKVEVRCPSCGKGYLVDAAKIPVGGGTVSCHACGEAIRLKPSGVPGRVPKPPAKGPAPVAPATPAAVDGARAGEVCCPRCNLHFVPGTQAVPSDGGRPTLLLVEDMDYFIEIARDALSGRYEVKTARTLDEARAILNAGGIDLLLLDIMLEHGEDGLRLLREPPGKICPVLLFTAQDESEMYGEGWTNLRAMGADDVVIKGMNMGELLVRKVGALLGEVEVMDNSLR